MTASAKRFVVDELVDLYFRIGLSYKDIIPLLAHKHSVVVSVRTLKRLSQKLCLSGGKNHTSMEEMAAFMQAGIERM